MDWIIQVSSITNAMRGKTVLERNGYTAYVRRAVDAQGNNGCGYSILVQGDGDKAERLLRNAAIRVVGRIQG